MPSNSYFNLSEVHEALRREAIEAVDDLFAAVQQGMMIEKDGRASVTIYLDPWLVRVIRVFSAARETIKEQDASFRSSN